MPSLHTRAVVLDALLAFAKTHPAVAAAAKVGSTAVGFRDQHSDIDLAVGVHETHSPVAFLDDGAAFVSGDGLGFAPLLDIAYRDAVYRVFLRADGLQLDLSARPQTSFAPTTERFALCFGESRPPEPKVRPAADALVREAVLYLRLADVAVRRDRVRQAQYFLDHVRERAQTALCLKHGLAPFDGRGFDELPAEVLARTAAGCAYGATPEELRAGVEVWAGELVALAGGCGVAESVLEYLRGVA